MHETKSHNLNLFLTLTYNDEHLPEGGTLVKRDLQLFMKRLRKEYGEGIRFFACGEYGDRNLRPHYHLILFNSPDVDLVKVKETSRGDYLYTSKQLSAVWSVDGKPIGNVIIGMVDFNSAAYVARYNMKKINGDKADDFYTVVDGNGVITRRATEFLLMSRRPGIGRKWYEIHGDETYAHDNLVSNYKLVRPPRYYDNLRDATDPKRMAAIKAQRRSAALAIEDRRNVDRKIAKRNFRDDVQSKKKGKEL